MPRPITAQQSRDIVSFVREQFEDQAYKTIKSDDIIFEFENFIQDEIAKNTFCLNDKDLLFAMIPNKEEYSLLEVIDTPQVILRIDKVSIIDSSGAESKPLEKLTEEMYREYRLFTGIATPKYYDFDRNRLCIVRPYGVTGYQVKLKYSRIPGDAEQCGYDQETVLPVMYRKFLKYGTAMMISAKYPEWSDRSQFFENIYNRYKNDYIKPTTTNNDKIDFREF